MWFKRLMQIIVMFSIVFVSFNLPYFQRTVEYNFIDQHVRVFEKQKNFLQIPSLGITVPVVDVKEVDEGLFQTALGSGVVRFPGSAEIGSVGVVYIFGHSSDYLWSAGKYKTVFALLPKIKINDEIVIINAEGEEFVYRVIKTDVINPDNLDYLKMQTDKKLLVLQTSYPLGTALKRFIVVGELVTENR